MIASQLALYACLGCIPMEEVQASRQYEFAQNIQNFEQLAPAPLAEDGALPRAPKPALSANPFSVANWSANEHMQKARVTAETLPAPLRFQAPEQFTAEWTFTANSADTGFGLDMSVAPRATLEKRGQFRTARAGAEVRLGQNLEDLVSSFDERGTPGSKLDSWYIFAGVDDEALCWDIGDKGAKMDGVALRDQVTVGDIQAGIAMQKAGGELSFGYVRREFSKSGASATEEFAAISFTMRR